MQKTGLFLKSIFLFIFGVCTLAAQEGRPLRSQIPDEEINIDKEAADCLALTVNYSLITENALSKPLTQHYIEQYSKPGSIANLNAVLQRANIYMPFIREELKKRQMPAELAFLPVIESGYVITARSRSGATGLWQFMMNSISPYDIKVTELVDERRDFIKSTRGALQKLQNEHRILGNWELTLAAYNAGLGGIRRTIQRTEINDYWQLCEEGHLRSETVNYIPKLAATATILSQPRKYGINIWHKKFEWEAIPLPRQISIDILASEAGINKDLLHRLNSELLYGITPIDSNYRLKIPSSHLAQVNEILERKDLRLIRYHYHIISYGDTLWSMSMDYGTTVPMIEQHNPGIAGRHLIPGETIIIPAFGDAPPVRPPAAPNNHNFGGTHIVQKGDTFWSLSRIYGVSPQVIAEANDMDLNQILHEGRLLKVPIIDQ